MKRSSLVCILAALAALMADSVGAQTTAFSLLSSPGVGRCPQSITATNLSGGGKPDLVCATWGNNTLTVLTNNGSGGFALASSPAVGNFPVAVTCAE